MVSTEACPTPIDDPNDPSVSGGPIDRFGAPPEMVPFNLDGQVTRLTCPLTLNRSIPYSQDSDAVPGLILRWTSPDGSSREYWLPLGQSGVLANGMEWTTSLRDYYRRTIIDLACTFPTGFCTGLAEGRYTISYIVQDQDGLRSNNRREHLDYGVDASIASLTPRRR